LGLCSDVLPDEGVLLKDGAGEGTAQRQVSARLAGPLDLLDFAGRDIPQLQPLLGKLGEFLLP
jgi:hypothetical protein